MSQRRSSAHREMATLGCSFYLYLCLLISSAVADVPLHRDWQAYQNKSLGMIPKQRFHSAPHISAPIYQVNTLKPEKADPSPFLFLTGGSGESSYGPSIVSAKDLSLVWSDENYGMAHSLQPYIFKGEPVLALYMGESIHIYNQHYQKLYVLQAHSYEGSIFDNHECHITTDDTAIIIYTHPVPLDLSSVQGPAEGEGVRDGRFQEIDPVDNKVLFEFSTIDHFPVNTTVWEYASPPPQTNPKRFMDYAHMNSVQKTPEGDYLVSYRHFSAIVLVDGKTSEIKWIMGGNLNQFMDISINQSAKFNFQHNPRFSGPNRITLFDNASLKNDFCPQEASDCSRGLEIEFDLDTMTVWVVNEYYHPQSINSRSRGGVQRLPNGGALVAWGQNPLYTEHAPDGEVVIDFQKSIVYSSVHGLRPAIAYRAWKGSWEGKPHWGPNISSNFLSEHYSIYVSWNGATNVHQWVLLTSDSVKDLDGPEHITAKLPRMGFETCFQLELNLSSMFARVAALDEQGNIIGSTPAVQISSGALLPLDYPIHNINKPGSKSISSSDQTPSDGSADTLPMYEDIPDPGTYSPLYLAGIVAVICAVILVTLTQRPHLRLRRWLFSSKY